MRFREKQVRVESKPSVSEEGGYGQARPRGHCEARTETPIGFGCLEVASDQETSVRRGGKSHITECPQREEMDTEWEDSLPRTWALEGRKNGDD